MKKETKTASKKMQKGKSKSPKGGSKVGAPVKDPNKGKK